MAKIHYLLLSILIGTLFFSVAGVAKPRKGSDVNFGVLGGQSMGKFEFPFVGAFFAIDMPERTKRLPSGAVQRRLKLNFRENAIGYWKISANLTLKKKKDGSLNKHADKDRKFFGRYVPLEADHKNNIYIVELREADQGKGIQRDTRKDPINTKKAIGKLKLQVDCPSKELVVTVLEADSSKIDFHQGEVIRTYPGGFSQKEKNIKIEKWTCEGDRGPKVTTIIHVNQTGNNKTFYVSDNDEFIEVDFAPDGTISRETVRDRWKNGSIQMVTPYGDESIVVLAAKKTDGTKGLWIKRSLSDAKGKVLSSDSDYSDDDKIRLKIDRIKFMTAVGEDLFLATHDGLWVKSLREADIGKKDFELILGTGWTDITSMIAVGHHLVFHHINGKLYGIDTTQPLKDVKPKILGRHWGETSKLAPSSDDEFIVLSPNFPNPQIKVASTNVRNKDAGAFTQGMPVGENYRLYKANDKLFSIKFKKADRRPQKDDVKDEADK